MRRPKLTGAQFGAFFYNVVDKQGEKHTLFTLSGAPREAFEGFGHPRPTPVFAPTFHGTAIVRSDDITKDPRYGQKSPHHGMPAGHLPVRSYLAVPVMSRTGDVIGGLVLRPRGRRRVHRSRRADRDGHRRLGGGGDGQRAPLRGGAACARRGRGREPGEVGIPRQHVARAAHAAQRDRRLRRAAEPGSAGRSPSRSARISSASSATSITCSS